MSNRPKIGPGKPLPSGPLNLNALTPAPLHAEQGDPKEILQYCAEGISVLTAVLNEAGAKMHHGQRALTEKNWTVARQCGERLADACGRAERIVAGKILAVGEDHSPLAPAAPAGAPTGLGCADVREGLEAVEAALQMAAAKHEGRAVALTFKAAARMLVAILEVYECASRYAEVSTKLRVIAGPTPVHLARELFEASGALAELSLSAIKAATLTERAATDKHFADAEAEWTKP